MRTPTTAAARHRSGEADGSSTERVAGIPKIRDRVVLGHQPVQVVDEALARILGILVVLAHVDRLDRTHLLAHAAEDAAELVDLVNDRIAVALIVLAGHQPDAVGRTD